MHWRLGLDVGTNSIGWWAYKVSKNASGKWKVARSLDGGVRLFPDGREPAEKGRVGDSMAVNRRKARGMRRNREHRKLRITKLVNTLIEVGLLPKSENERSPIFQTRPAKEGDPETWYPYRLRAKAAQEKVEPFELGRALCHLGLRRGYQSNRKESDKDDGGKLKDRMTALDEELAGRTLGEYLWHRLKEENAKPTKGAIKKRPESIRFSPENPFFSTRAMYETEFDDIRPNYLYTSSVGSNPNLRIRNKTKNLLVRGTKNQNKKNLSR